MSAIIVLFAAMSCFIAAYIIYGRWLALKLDIDPNRETPAHSMRDNIDYVPAKAPVLLGHHFASIAGAAPIIGPITAAAFGWVPVFRWIVIGSLFFGGVHTVSGHNGNFDGAGDRRRDGVAFVVG